MKTSERHRIKRDELATVLERLAIAAEDNLKPLAITVSVIVVLGAGVLFYNRWSRGRESEAAYRLGEVQQIRRAPLALSLESMQNAPPGTPTFMTSEDRAERIVELADAIADDYGSTAAAPRAMYYKAIALADLGRHDESITILESILSDHSRDFIAPLARFKLARVLESAGRPAEALTHFQILAEDARGHFPREEGLLGAARCHERLGQKDQALRTYERVLNEFPGSEYSPEARQKLDELS